MDIRSVSAKKVGSARSRRPETDEKRRRVERRDRCGSQERASFLHRSAYFNHTAKVTSLLRF